MTLFDAITTPLPRRLREGLDRIAAAMRADEWGVAEEAGLTPTQLHALTFIAGRGEAGLRLRAVAEHLGVTQPTATDSIAALTRKGLVTKLADPADKRAIAIRVTPAGCDVVRAIGLAMTSAESALETLTPQEQQTLLDLVIKTIRALQKAKAIPPQRLCVSCRHFRPHAHADAELPHHCALVDAAFGGRHLRLDCPEHDPAPPAESEAVWSLFAHHDAEQAGA
ncbi:MarR family winged helix-turn-helix transcriptional regulator [Methylosinus sp. LW4]|uniref:MarR family winged helix-turn-helix transcriptional regulator n=1 Tax=Methylosinus sp. LW4 TaxID=136993 RepID=UPI00039B69DF|nr:MarR family winged helix-turn-helix transcriptional regulator [Methylosinus sp. LW4]